MNSGTDEIHKLTEAIYKILLTGKAYYKSLQVASSAANAYNEALGRVGSAAKICRGGTEEIGEAILQIAEAQKELQARLEDSYMRSLGKCQDKLDQFRIQGLKSHEGFEPMNGGPGFQGNGFLHRDTQSLGNGFMRSQSSQDLYSQYGHFDGSQTLPPRTAGPVPPGDMRVQAVFSFTAGVDNQMSFTDGDIITLMGEKSEGWQYGHNNSTQRPSHRAMSVGERLDSRSLSDYPREYEHDIPGNIRRPKSLYEGSPHTSPAPVYIKKDKLHGLYSERDISPDSVYTSYGRPIQDRSQSTTPVHSRHFSSSQVPIPPPQFHGPPSMSTPAAPVQPFHTRSYTLPTHTSSIPRMTPPSNPAPLPGNNAVPPPPPPPPPPPIPGQSNNTNTKTTPAHTARSIMASPMHKPTSAPQPPVPPPFNPPPGMKHPNAPTSMSHLSQQRSPSSRTSTSGIPGHASPSRQQVSQPPPAPPGEIEETVNYRNNPMFATVALRQTKTNDRSAPKI
ncbi:hypothetical protein MAR_028239 [Mya arenaria]|uniref:IMD domain-containing protein n=1 Tax=Mya arenaria TaxID=6604 RepID=A0ABY7DD20_MYAAR|nr:hypothetical protein MAR_028239 [Mya arenaria]